MIYQLDRLSAFLIVIVGFALLMATAPARAGGDVVAPVSSHNKFTGWWELGGFYGTDDSSRGEVVLFTPLMQSATTLFFLDARGKLFEEDVQEANLALGYRQMMTSGWNLGLWAGWDIRDTEEDNTFHQVSFGLEALSERFDLRVNGYVPITDPKGSPGLAEVFLRGNNILMIGGEEVPLYGVDGEVGVLLFGGNRGGGLKGAPAPAKRHELRAYAGGFWFDADEALEEVAGPKGRLEYRINDVITSLPGSRLTIESELSYDEVRDTKFEIGARLRIPFGARGSDALSRHAALTGQELRMTEGLERDTDIVTVQSEEENVLDDATNVAMNAVSFANDAAGFANAVNQGGNRLIILQDDGAQIDVSGTDGQQLQNNQTVQGGGSTLNYRGARSGTVAGFTAPGQRPTLFTNDVNGATGAITVANNTHLAGLNIRGVGDQTTFVAGNHAVRGLSGLNNVVIERMDIRNMGDDAIEFFDDNSNFRIHHTTIADVGSHGIHFNSDNSNIWLRYLDISKVDDQAIDFNSRNRNVWISDVSIDDVRTGIQFNIQNTNVHIQRAEIFTTSFDAVSFNSENENVTITNANIRNSATDGIAFNSENEHVTIGKVDIVNVDQIGISFNSENSNVEIKNVSVDGATNNDGIDFLNLNSNVTISHVDVWNVGNVGIDIAADNTDISIVNSTVDGTVSSGIETGSGNQLAVRNTRVVNAGVHGINVSGPTNVVNIQDVVIDGAGLSGLQIAANNIVTMNDTTFTGNFGSNVLQINGDNTQTLAGDGNVFNGTTLGVFCNSGPQNGFFGFSVGPQPTCP